MNKAALVVMISTLTVLISGADPANAQTACARALMMAGPEVSRRSYNENEVVQKRQLQQLCQQELNDERNRQMLAQNRIAARSAWGNVRPEVRNCIDRKLEYDGLNIEEVIKMGIAPSDPALQDYRVSCINENPRK
jgi:hypothetical protein